MLPEEEVAAIPGAISCLSPLNSFVTGLGAGGPTIGAWREAVREAVARLGGRLQIECGQNYKLKQNIIVKNYPDN